MSKAKATQARGSRKASSPASTPAPDVALIARYADAYLSANQGTGGHRTVFAQPLMDDVADPAKAGKLGDYYVLDIRAPADYAAGHIAGAVNVPLGDLAKPHVLAAFPTDRRILVICYTGHTASIATAILGLLGYDAWTLRFGMLSWRAASPMAVWSPTAKQDITGGDYPVLAGAQP